MQVVTDVVVRVPDLDVVSVGARARSGEDRAVSGRHDRRSVRGRVIDAEVRGVLAQHRVEAPAAEVRTDARVFEGRAQELLAQ